MTAPSNKQMTCTQCGSCDLEEDLEQVASVQYLLVSSHIQLWSCQQCLKNDTDLLSG